MNREVRLQLAAVTCLLFVAAGCGTKTKAESDHSADTGPHPAQVEPDSRADSHGGAGPDNSTRRHHAASGPADDQ